MNAASYHLISIILPIYNQEEHVGLLVEEYQSALAKISLPYEILLVPNGCRDRSVSICEELAQRYDGVRLVGCKEKGWGAAVKTGIRSSKGDLVCYTNSARTSSKDLTLLLLYAIANPGVVVTSSRKVRESWLRRLGSVLYNLECRTLFDLSCWDVNGTPKVFPRKFDDLFSLDCSNDLIDLEFHFKCRRSGYPLLEVPTLSWRRHAGKSTTNFKSAFKMYIGAYQLWKKQR